VALTGRLGDAVHAARAAQRMVLVQRQTDVADGFAVQPAAEQGTLGGLPFLGACARAQVGLVRRERFSRLAEGVGAVAGPAAAGGARPRPMD